MSGRFFLTTRTGLLGELFGLGDGRGADGRTVSRGPRELKARYNIAPGQEIAVVRAASGARRELAMVRWGLIPGWASASDIGVQITSCPVETADSVPSVRESFQGRRCLIPADGFYEWRSLAGGERAPMLVRLRPLPGRGAAETFGIAGLFDRWVSDDGTVAIESCVMLTVPSNGVVRGLCARMPAVVRAADYSSWLGGAGESAGEGAARLKDLCRAWPEELTSVRAVNPAVNSPRFDDPLCLEEAGAG